MKVSVYSFLNIGILYSLTHGNYVYRQTHSVMHKGFAAVIWSWICALGSLHSISLSWPGLDLSIVTECFPKYWSLTRFLTHLNPICTKIGLWPRCSGSPQALLGLQFSEATAWGQSFMGYGWVRRDVVFLPLNTTRTHTHVHAHKVTHVHAHKVLH